MTTFRVHFADGAVWDVTAESPDAARKMARRWIDEHGLVTKIKVLKEYQRAAK